MKILSNHINTMWQLNRRIYVELAKTKKYIFDNYSFREHNLLNFSIKINEIFRTHTEGLNAGKSVSDFVFMS